MSATTDTQRKAEERAHHLFSPSSLQNREACPCYENRNEAHVKAITGTIQHSVTETGEDDHRLDDDEALAAAECMDFFERRKTIFQETRERAFMAAGQPEIFPEVICISEAYLPVDDCEFEDVVNGATVKTQSTTAGYVDRGLVSWQRTYAELHDWKFGAWAVEKAENNLQGIAYSLGLFKKFPSLEKITFFFKQPQLNILSEATFTRSQVPELYLRVQTVVARARQARALMAKDDFSMANPMVPACNFCANIGRCPKVAEFACRVGNKFAPLMIPADITPTGLKSTEDTAIGLRLSQVMAVWAKAFRSQITERTIRGTTEVPDGFRLETKSDREIKDTAKFREVTLKYLTEAELASLASYTFGSVEDKIKEKSPRGTKKGTLEVYQKDLIDSGAVVRGDPYTYLKAVSKTDDK